MANNRNFVDRAIRFYADRVNYYKALTNTDNKRVRTPRHISSDAVNPFQGLTFENEEALQKAASVLSWIYADIELISRNVWGTDLTVKKESKNGKMTKDPRHPFLSVYQCPNEWMTKSFLIEYLIGWLLTSKKGAFAFLAPDMQTGELAEIWPINPNQIEPIRSTSNYVDKFVYYPKGESERRKPIIIDGRFILWIRYADRFDYWKSMPPLRAALAAAEIEMGIEASQHKLYNESRGLPLTVVSLDENLNPTDFESAKEQIRADWEDSGSSIAVTRAGRISTASLGFTQSELQTILAQRMTRDKIDTIFFGFAIRSEEFASGEGLKEMDRMIKEQTIRPLLILLQDHFQNQIINRWYDEDVAVEYADPRTADRALNIQESMIYSRWRTIDEMRERDGDPPLEEIPEMPGIGKLLVQQALNSAFLSTYYQLAPEPVQDTAPELTEVGNITSSRAPEAVANEEAGAGGSNDTAVNVKSMSPAEKLGISSELKRWRTVARREMKKSGTALNRDFESEVIPETIMKSITGDLFDNIDDQELEEIFSSWLTQLS